MADLPQSAASGASRAWRRAWRWAREASSDAEGGDLAAGDGAAGGGTSRTGLVFTWEDGSLINPERLSTWFRRHCVEAELPVIRLHDVRHSYASAGLANATGWHEVKVISQRLGHANVAITIDTYSHVLPAADAATAHTLAKLILGGS